MSLRAKLNEHELFVLTIARAIRRYWRLPMTNREDIKHGLIAALWLARKSDFARKLEEIQ